ncbi:hypothetical protein KI809_10730 [Geobacter pelophilus]|uniref:Mu-like prophage FluMu N-terminal domain-containing protein n=1 Tax=Geoanaerobacter pelophilus TaxID=60036 RepID=A0AAW4L5H1_9BACT|nr:HI1506-related protein [Geoanaerobacter pelophilus]MBT0664775.1 hypothetical protein [Geoanaerobacter pelophilus]
MLLITAKQDGFRRCGLSHPKETTEYPDNKFTREELAILQSEPMLVVTVSPDNNEQSKPGKPLGAADLIAKITVAETEADIEAILNGDQRATVVAAAAARKAELAKAAE